ncbi:MAG: transporter substrate-binding domain-containing protein [Usitatibacter sp.]
MNGFRGVRALACAAALIVSACATLPPATPADVAALAPIGALRVGLYPGSPTSIIPAEGGTAPRGVAYDLGRDLAKELGVAFEPVVFPSNDKVLDAVRRAAVDLVFTNATQARAAFIDFTPAVLQIEKGYLVPARSTVREASALDRSGIRIGISRGSTTQAELGEVVRSATLVPVASIDEAVRDLSEGRLEAFATNKAILFQMSDRLPGSRVLDGRWGEETFALGVPKGRPAAAISYLRGFVQFERSAGAVRRAAERAGLRGMSEQ